MSVRALKPHVPIGVLDLGLTTEQVAWLGETAARVVRPGWDVEFPGRERMPETSKPRWRGPSCRGIFQVMRCISGSTPTLGCRNGARSSCILPLPARDKIAIALELDRAYKRHYKRPKLFGMNLVWKTYREAFGWRAADRLGRNPTANCGVFALHRDAPHWQAWARLFKQVLQRTRFFFVEQIALNYAIFAEGLPANFLPAYCNWAVGDALPAVDTARGLFVEPHAPHEVIGVMHLAGRDQKSGIHRLDRLDGGTVETSLRYGESRVLCTRSGLRREMLELAGRFVVALWHVVGLLLVFVLLIEFAPKRLAAH